MLPAQAATNAVAACTQHLVPFHANPDPYTPDEVAVILAFADSLRAAARVLELGGETGRDKTPRVYPGSYDEYVQALGHEAPGIYA